MASSTTPAAAVAAGEKEIGIGTRKSLLARIQADMVQAALQKAWPDKKYAIHAMSTMGDNNQVTALHDFNAKSLWTHELEALLLEGKLDLIVHCLKDMPTQLPPTLSIAAVMEREDPRDCVIISAKYADKGYTTLASLPAGSVVGTSSVRRSAQIARQYPELKFADVRGNVGTRLAKLDDPEKPYTCLVLAAAGLKRLDLAARISQYLESDNGGVLHAVGQGSLAIEIRADDAETLQLLAPLEHVPSKLACLAERSLMRTLEGGCSVPIGVETKWTAEKQLSMKYAVVSIDGTESVHGHIERAVTTVEEADQLGWDAARDLVERGAGKILEKINLNRKLVDA
ncbi:porphobilinogen deaminase [Xylona heveae TC161]|uniref:Porphobilinogen deaminase n=1 Tax=Xylona heveae (strain CBS 132557 / TC161) TaxID=1328760 RepID=A0A165JWZ0_XYLHT|nr:porphobilinogen deaminase [Xylona heveae TC161]KZF26728.1 porphobilinogen deaminase [Xylona heveae TC161]